VDAWRYVPLVVPPEVRDWLRQGIVSPRARCAVHPARRSAQISVQRARHGLFQVQAAIEDGVVQFASGWPKMQAVRGRLAVLGNRLEITGNEARILGATLRNVTVVIPDLSDSKPLLQARGEADGPTSEFLRFVREVRCARGSGLSVEGCRRSGAGHLTLSVDMPLLHASDFRANGTYAFTDNVLTPPEAMPVEQFSGRLLFTQSEVNLPEAQGRVYGKPAQAERHDRGRRRRAPCSSGQVDGNGPAAPVQSTPACAPRWHSPTGSCALTVQDQPWRARHRIQSGRHVVLVACAAQQGTGAAHAAAGRAA
jgi:uncharacterized protein YhdP